MVVFIKSRKLGQEQYVTHTRTFLYKQKLYEYRLLAGQEI